MIMTVNPKTRKILLTSIPRDCYIKLASEGAMDKLTHSGLYGIEETTASVENLFGVKINYYAKVNFSTVVNLVDALDGTTVYSDYSFTAYDRDDVTPYYLTEGENYIMGEEALAFSRERFSFSEGDGQRIKNQQSVIKGVIDKITGSTVILTNYNSILNSIEGNFQTSLSMQELTALVKIQLGDMRGWEIQQQTITGEGDIVPVYSMPTSVYVLIPDMESVIFAAANIKTVMADS